MALPAQKYRDTDEVNKVTINAKNRLENYCIAARSNQAEEKVSDKFAAEHMNEAVQDPLKRLDQNTLVEKVELEARHEELQQQQQERQPHSSQQPRTVQERNMEKLKREEQEEEAEGNEEDRGRG